MNAIKTEIVSDWVRELATEEDGVHLFQALLNDIGAELLHGEVRDVSNGLHDHPGRLLRAAGIKYILYNIVPKGILHQLHGVLFYLADNLHHNEGHGDSEWQQRSASPAYRAFKALVHFLTKVF